ncbi:Radial spoke head protein 3-like [Papilio machaon]|uniref:Radial spoke head protein 3-like n=1 Tax=Papilio machaon TaxID=76193 RepID=A0A194RDK5_PAPMA|nr:Radial spoke head protein 3-like [Papilio machaon]
MSASLAPSDNGLPVVDNETPQSDHAVKRNHSNVNIVRPLVRPPVDSRTALDPKFSRALDFKLRRLKEKELLEANLRRPVRPRHGMGALAASECNLHLSQDRAEREKAKNRSHPHINCIPSMDRVKLSPRMEESPSPDQKKRNKQNEHDKPRFVTTVKTGQFLLPPPEVAYLLGLHTLYPSQDREKVVYSYASKPKAVTTRPKRSVAETKDNRMPNGGPNVDASKKGMNPGEAFRGVRALIASVAGMRHMVEKQDKVEEVGPRNLMHDRRVVRGSTFAPQTAHAHAAGDGANKSRRRALARRAALARLRPGTPPPAPGRRHLPVQTEHYLQELFDKGVELEVGVQTDLFADRPATPIYVPAKTGADAHTQIYPGDLFDFDLEVQPILETLVGKTAEQALAEVAQEEELATLREQQRRYLELRDAERAERQRLLAQDIRLQAEKERRVGEARLAQVAAGEARSRAAAAALVQGYVAELLPSVLAGLRCHGYLIERIQTGDYLSFFERRVGEARLAQVAAGEARSRAAAAALVQGYVAELLPSVLAGLRCHGYLIERIQTGVNEEVMPWLVQEVSLEIESIITSRDVITEIVREVVETRAQAPTPLHVPDSPTPPSTPSMMLEGELTPHTAALQLEPFSIGTP